MNFAYANDRSNSDTGSSKDFLSLKGGQSVQGVFRGDPHVFRIHWPKGGVKTLCPGRDVCEKCKSGEKNSFKFAINFVVRENGAMTAKVFEGGWKIYCALADLQKSGWNLEMTTVQLSRTGSTQSDTVYSVTPIPNGELKNGALKTVAAVKLHDLAAPAAPAASEQQPESDGKEDDLPF
jgi:hypothetical protein